METPRCAKILNLSADWKLNPNVECRIILNKLKIKTPEDGTMEFCRTLRDLSVLEPAPAVSTTADMHFKSEFVLDILLNEILGKCAEKCKVCEEYVQELRHHIIQAHSGHPNPSPHPQTVTVFKCDICSSMYSSPSMLIRHRNTHSDTSDTLTTTCTNDPEPVRFDSNNISALFDISSVSRTNESVISNQCENNSLQAVPVLPKNFEWSSLKQESSESHSHSQIEILNPNPLGILEHVNHLSTIENNLKQESDDLECEEDLQLDDPLILPDVHSQVHLFVKYESTGLSTESEQQTVLMTHEKSSNDTHTDTDNSPVLSDLIRHKITTQSSQRPHKCDTCGKCFSTLHNLTRHKLIHTGERPYKCDVCEKCFGQRFALTRHKFTHTGDTRTRPKSFHCDVCGRGFTHKRSFARHKLIHTGEKRFHCDECGQDFTHKHSLGIHKLKHTGEKPYTCDSCGQSFYQRSNLNQHRLVHTGEKPHECNVCGKCFALHSNLTKHKRIHTGEKLFRCDECGQNFYGQHELTKHKLMHTWQSTTTTLQSHLKEERESEEEACQEDPLLNLEVSF